MNTVHVIDQLEAFLAGGLSADEQAAFEAHIAGCPECAAALKEATDMDAAMNQLFAVARPAPGFEDRLVQRLRKSPRRRLRIHPMVIRVAAGVAAGLMLAGVGYVGNASMNGRSGELSFGLSNSRLGRQARAVVAHFTYSDNAAHPSVTTSNLRQVGLGLSYYSIDGLNRQLGDKSADVASLSTAQGRQRGLDANFLASDYARATTNAPAEANRSGRTSDWGLITPRERASNKEAEVAEATRGTTDAYMLQSRAEQKGEGAKQQASEAHQDTTALAHNGTALGFQANLGVEPLGRKPQAAGGRSVAFGDTNAYPKDQYDSVLLPTDDKDGDREGLRAVPQLPQLSKPPVTLNLSELDKDKKLAEHSYFSLNTGIAPSHEVRDLEDLSDRKSTDARGAVSLLRQQFTDTVGKPVSNLGKEPAGVKYNVERAPAATDLAIEEKSKSADVLKDGIAQGVDGEKAGNNRLVVSRNPSEEPAGVPQQPADFGTPRGFSEVNAPGITKQSTVAGVSPGGGDTFARAQQTVPALITGEPKPADAQTPPTTATPPPQQANVQQPPASVGPKIIRNGDIEFEVDSFDSSVMQIGKIATEEGGYVSTTESDKLPNGKVKGRVVLRCPPERLDTLVLKLRGIGDLRTQRIGAQDVTKQYTDTESALRAAHAMQERLLDIIKNGKGAVKDLLEAEKQLGVWREKIEQLEGEIRYFNNLISLSTLSVTLYERDIKTPAVANETETVAMSLETEKVEDAYQKAREAIAEAKGRITASELKQFDAGQYRATISALLPPDAAEAVIARVKQLEGRMAHFERQRSQSSAGEGAATRADPMRIKREDVVVNLTIYNLANIAPRRTTTLLIVAPNVEESYRNLIDQVNSAGGRVVTSTISKPRPDQSAGIINFSVPTDKADVILAAIRGIGEVLKTDTSESPDTQNVTESKRGFSVTVSSLAAFAARETHQVQLAAGQVPDAFNEVLNAVRGKDGRIINSQLNEQDAQNVTGTIDFEVARDAVGVIEQAMHHSSEVVARVVTRSTDTENTVDTKIHFAMTVASSDRLPARETVQTQLAAASVVDSFNAIRAGVPKGGRILVSELNEQDPQNISARLIFDLPQSAAPTMNDLLKKNTAILSRQMHRVPEGQIAVEKLRVELTLVSADQQSPRETTRMGVQVMDVQKTAEDLIKAAASMGGRQSESPSTSQDSTGHTTSVITIDVPADKAQAVLDQIDAMGNRRTKQSSLNTQIPDSPLARARIEVTLSDSAASLGGTESMSDYIRNGLMTSLKGLGYSLMWITIGICLIAPWALLIWGMWKFARRSRGKIVAPAAS